jgi:hypothetical protein
MFTPKNKMKKAALLRIKLGVVPKIIGLQRTIPHIIPKVAPILST